MNKTENFIDRSTTTKLLEKYSNFIEEKDTDNETSADNFKEKFETILTKKWKKQNNKHGEMGRRAGSGVPMAKRKKINKMKKKNQKIARRKNRK